MSKTSWQVKEKYNSKNYGKVIAQLPIDLVNDFKLKCKADGVSQASIIKKAIEAFLTEK